MRSSMNGVRRTRIKPEKYLAIRLREASVFAGVEGDLDVSISSLTAREQEALVETQQTGAYGQRH